MIKIFHLQGTLRNSYHIPWIGGGRSVLILNILSNEDIICFEFIFTKYTHHASRYVGVHLTSTVLITFGIFNLSKLCFDLWEWLYFCLSFCSLSLISALCVFSRFFFFFFNTEKSNQHLLCKSFQFCFFIEPWWLKFSHRIKQFLFCIYSRYQ